MTEITMGVSSDIVLPHELRSQVYGTNNVKNNIELQTLEKAFDRVVATSKDSASITFNLPSISGGAIYRNIELEAPITWGIAYKSTAPASSVAAAGQSTGVDDTITQINAGTLLWEADLGTNVRPFLKEFSCLDQFPLSKIFNDRTYQFNNSSVVLKENLTVEQIDAMVACMNIDKMENDGLAVFADANSQFDTLNATFGGILLPFAAIQEAGTAYVLQLEDGQFVEPANDNSYNVTLDARVNSNISNTLNKIFDQSCFHADKIVDNWCLKRNTARNIISSTVTGGSLSNGATWSSDPRSGFGNNLVPVKTSATAGGLAVSAYYDETNTILVTFKTVVREQLVSQYFNHEYAFNEFNWNTLIPLSTLNMKFVFNQEYLSQGVLKMGENIAAYGTDFQFTQYPTIGNISECYFIMKSCKIPIALQTTDSYKCLFYDQIKPQGGVKASVSGNKISATVTYANLSQVSDYIMPYFRIDRAGYVAAETEKYAYQLPTVFNLPTTNLYITFNSESGLCTYNLDYFELQKMTLQNLQENEKLRELIVGKSENMCTKRALGYGVSSSTNLTSVTGFLTNFLNSLYSSSNVNERVKFSGVSNSSFNMLKLGQNLRLPDSYCPGMIINHNITITATCDLSHPLFRQMSDYTGVVLGDFIASPNFAAYLEVVHFVKKIFSLSGSALQILYVHDIKLAQSEYLALRAKYEAAFASKERETIFSSDYMIGGAGIGNRIKHAVTKALPYLAQVPKVARQVADVVGQYAPHEGVRDVANKVSNVAKMFGGMDANIVTGGSAMDPQVVTGGRGRKSGATSAVSKAQWSNYLQNL